MRGLLFSLMLLAIACCVSQSTRAEDATSSSKQNEAWVADNATVAHIRDLVAHTDGAEGVFVVNDDGSVKHVQSGMLCPPKFPNVDFWHAEIFSSSLDKGMDVGCDYGRNGPDGHAVAKLTIFATKAPAGMTLEQVFAKYKSEITSAAPNAVSRGEALHDDTPPDKRTREYCSEEFWETIDGKPFTSQVFVEIEAGWIVEIRSTYEGVGLKIEVTKETGVQGAVLAAGDRLMGPTALMRFGIPAGK